MTTDVCEELGLGTVPREGTPGLRPVMEKAGVDQALTAWSATRRHHIEDVLEGSIDQYIHKHGRLPGERARRGPAWWAEQETRPGKKTPRPLEQLPAWWRVSALLTFGHRMVDGLLERCRAAGTAIRAQVGPRVNTALAAVDITVVAFTIRGTFTRRHILTEARRRLLETLHGRRRPPGPPGARPRRSPDRWPAPRPCSERTGTPASWRAWASGITIRSEASGSRAGPRRSGRGSTG
ncbi:relaxase domain-containing protein [Streptomyces sp. 2132.2]|uniref:relaxase domain-containing protein n=1 Tax=Streptomyces sp. 2132.2 TaxID=2485161 RepID=UPI0037D9BE69